MTEIEELEKRIKDYGEALDDQIMVLKDIYIPLINNCKYKIWLIKEDEK